MLKKEVQPFDDADILKDFFVPLLGFGLLWHDSEVKNSMWLQEVVQKHNLEL